MIHWTDIAGQLAQSNQFIMLNKETNRISELDFHALDHWVHELRERYTLIARSVDDMTKEEQQNHKTLLYIETDYDESMLYTKEGPHVEVDSRETPESFLYLISIGVLPPNVSTEGVEFTTTNGE